MGAFVSSTSSFRPIIETDNSQTGAIHRQGKKALKIEKRTYQIPISKGFMVHDVNV